MLRGKTGGAVALGWIFVLVISLLGASAHAADDEAAGDPELPWLDNPWYKVHLNVRARIELADINGSRNSEAYTLRTRAGLEAKPYYGFSAMAELENTYSPASDQYFDGASNNDGKSVIADPENTELNRLWGQYETHSLFGAPVRVKAKAYRQRIVFDDARFIGNVIWRQNEQTFDAALGESDFGVDDLTAQYAYLWDIRRIWGDKGSSPSTQDFSSNSHLARLHYAGLEDHEFTVFAYLLDFRNDSPGNSSNSYGARAVGSFPLGSDDRLGFDYVASYAWQTEARKNPEHYDAHYLWLTGHLRIQEIGRFGVGYEMLGSDGGDQQFVTPLATAHKFNGFADAFLDNGGPRGLQDLFVTVQPALPWQLAARFSYHEYFRADGGGDLGREVDAVISRPIGRHLLALFKGAWFDGSSQGPEDRWRLVFELNFDY